MTGKKERWTILEVLDWTREHFAAKGIDNPRLDAEVLLAHALKMERIMLYAHFQRPLEAEELAEIRGAVARRARGEPVAYIVGSREFWSMALEVTPDVLIPRPDTERLVEVALELLSGTEAPVVADVGTGSGCVALAIAKERPDARVFALDTSDTACAIARRNSEKHGLTERVTVLKSDLLSGLPPKDPPIDLLAANLPYIRTDALDELMVDVRAFEPRLALDGGPDGLDIIRRLAADAPAYVAPGGAVALEADPDQLPTIQAALEAAGFQSPHKHADLTGTERVLSARLAKR